jgi:hypothetical protein
VRLDGLRRFDQRKKGNVIEEPQNGAMVDARNHEWYMSIEDLSNN